METKRLKRSRLVYEVAAWDHNAETKEDATPRLFSNQRDAIEFTFEIIDDIEGKIGKKAIWIYEGFQGNKITASNMKKFIKQRFGLWFRFNESDWIVTLNKVDLYVIRRGGKS